MNEQRICQNCKVSFVIDASDFDFYKKMQVPPPTFCPDCRQQRRMNWRNERSFYKGKCAATGKDFLTMFSPHAQMTVYDRDYWWSDAWDQLDSGRDYDFGRPFFEQFAELLRESPLPNLANSNCIGGEWGNHSLDMKNSYLFHASAVSENVAYVTGAVETKDSFDLYKVLKGEQCYEVVLCGDAHQLAFSYNADECLQSAFLFSCKNMQQSLGCVNMRNHSYCILNKQYSKEDFLKERANYDFGSYQDLEAFKKTFADFSVGYPRRFATVLKSVNTTGNQIINAKNAQHCFDGYGGIEDCKYVCHAFSLQDSYDAYGAGRASSFLYEVVDVGAQGHHVFAGVFTHACQNTAYTYACHGSSYLFGCVGLRSKKYCILNKQYTKEQYEELVPKIIAQMNAMPFIDEHGRTFRYGEFFPAALSPFAYNETIAQEYAPLVQAEAEKQGFKWREPEVRHHAITLKTDGLPDHIKDVQDSILGEVIECAHRGGCNQQCTSAFKIIPSELQFLRSRTIALPRLCPNCRHYERLAKRTPFKLWHRRCMNSGCKNEFETSYAPDRPEIVYCETCYQQEVQ